MFFQYFEGSGSAVRVVYTIGLDEPLQVFLEVGLFVVLHAHDVDLGAVALIDFSESV